MSAQNQKTIFITSQLFGALGRAAANLLASKGWAAVATMRNPEKETELNKPSSVGLMALDITDPKQFGSMAAKVVAGGGVDVVFKNAGYGMAGPLEG